MSYNFSSKPSSGKLLKPNLRVLAETYLKNYIQNNSMKSGDLLPPEKELSEKLGISRTAVREALKGLESLGVTKAHQGKGHIVQDFSYQRIVESFGYGIKPSLINFKNLLEIRMCLEPNFLVGSLSLFSSKDIDELFKLLEHMEKEEKFADEDTLIDNHMIFHHRLFQFNNNTLLLELVSMFSSIQHKFTAIHGYTTTDKSNFFSAHYEIVDSLKLGHPDIVKSKYVVHFSEIFNWVNDRLNSDESKTENF
jgi:GntR family transcriptional regulator, transcriptional repressor for pyruvate dehydrogenase complex